MTRKAEESPPRMRYFTPASRAWRLRPLVGDEDVEGNCDELERDEKEHEVVRRGKDHQADRGEERQNDELAAAVPHRFLRLLAHPDDQRGHRDEKEVEKLRRAVPLRAFVPEEVSGRAVEQERQGRDGAECRPGASRAVWRGVRAERRPRPATGTSPRSSAGSPARGRRM